MTKDRRQTKEMNQHSTLLAAFLFAASCTPVPLFYQEGGSVALVQDTRLDCEVEALAKAPVATQLRQAAPRYIPGYRSCRSDGRCLSRGGFFVDGAVYSVDANARLRRDLVTQCMQRAGYQRIDLPRCTSQTDTVGSIANPAQMPELTEASCAAKDAAGTWQVVTP